MSIKDVIRQLPSSPIGVGVAFSDVPTPSVIVYSDWKLLCGEKTTQHTPIFLRFSQCSFVHQISDQHALKNPLQVSSNLITTITDTIATSETSCRIFKFMKL